MQHPFASCQLRAPETGNVAPKYARETEHTSGRRVRWTPDPAETIAHTASRRTGPRAWLRALERAVAAGLVPGFNDTTRAIIEVLASRMGYDTGHCRYVLRDVMERTGLGRTAVTDHVKMLRRAGWLAWVEHGSLRNALRALGLDGYARTATVYAATIPPAYDAYAGNTVIGTGYEARIIVDHRGKSPVDTTGNEAVENPDVDASRTPSLWGVKEEGQVQVVGGEETSTARAAVDEAIRKLKKRKLTITGYKITGPRIERARQLARWVRPLVNWLQRATLDQLSWVLLDLVARDWTDNQILVWLGRLGQETGAVRRRPRFPHRVIAAALLRKDREDTQRAEGHLPGENAAPAAPNAAFQAAREALRTRRPQEPAAVVPTVDQVPVGEWDRATLRDAAAADPTLVLSCARHVGREETLRLYGSAAAAILDAADEEARTGLRILATA